MLLLFSCSVMSDSWQLHGLQHVRLPYPILCNQFFFTAKSTAVQWKEHWIWNEKIIIIQTLSSIIYHLCFSKTWVRSLNWDVQLTESQLIIPLPKVWSNWEMDTHIGHKCDIQCLPSQGSEKKAFNMQAIKSKTDQRPWMHRIFSSLRASQVVLVVKKSACQCRRCKRGRFDPWVEKNPWSRKWHPSILAWKIPWAEEPGRLHGVTKSWTQLTTWALTLVTPRYSSLPSHFLLHIP